MRFKSCVKIAAVFLLGVVILLTTCCAPKVDAQPGGIPPTPEQISRARLADLKARATRFPVEVQGAITVFNALDLNGLGADPAVVHAVGDGLSRLKNFADQAKPKVLALTSLDLGSQKTLLALGKQAVDLINQVVQSGETFNIKNPQKLLIFKLAIGGLAATAGIIEQYLGGNDPGASAVFWRFEPGRDSSRVRLDVLVPLGLPVKISKVEDTSEPGMVRFSLRKEVPDYVTGLSYNFAFYDYSGAELNVGSFSGQADNHPIEIATVDKRVFRIVVMVEAVESPQGKWRLASSLDPAVFMRDSSRASWALLTASFEPRNNF